MTGLLVLPLVLQAAVMAVDEGWFHRRRGLPRWERVGHPLDTLSVAVTYIWALAGGSTLGYAVLAFGSCLFITKDEFVHRRLCRPGECWVHALLFVLHPIVFVAFALLLRAGHTALAGLQLAVTLGFGAYQLLYWNLRWKPAR